MPGDDLSVLFSADPQDATGIRGRARPGELHWHDAVMAEVGSTHHPHMNVPGPITMLRSLFQLCGPVVVALSLAGGFVNAATLHVSPSGTDGAAGTAQAPLASLQAALEKIGPAGGGEIVLLDGIWPARSRTAAPSSNRS